MTTLPTKCCECEKPVIYYSNFYQDNICMHCDLPIKPEPSTPEVKAELLYLEKTDCQHEEDSYGICKKCREIIVNGQVLRENVPTPVDEVKAGWEDEFDSLYANKWKPGHKHDGNCEWICSLREEIKSFISSLVLSEREKGYKEGLESRDEELAMKIQDAYKEGVEDAVGYIKANGAPGTSKSDFGPDIEYYKIAVESLEALRDLLAQDISSKKE